MAQQFQTNKQPECLLNNLGFIFELFSNKYMNKKHFKGSQTIKSTYIKQKKIYLLKRPLT